MQSSVPEGKQPSHVCNICGKSFTIKSNLNRHSLIHEGRKPNHTCNICCKQFSRKSNLDSHLIIHKGIAPFVCKICTKGFYKRSYLKAHLLSHDGIKPFRCDICDKGFTEKSSLKRHSSIHQGMRSHKCDTCGKSFNQTQHLKNHSYIHGGVKPFCCDVCGKTFIYKISLKNHIAKHENSMKSSTPKQNPFPTVGKQKQNLGVYENFVEIVKKEPEEFYDEEDTISNLDPLGEETIVESYVNDRIDFPPNDGGYNIEPQLKREGNDFSVTENILEVMIKEESDISFVEVEQSEQI